VSSLGRDRPGDDPAVSQLPLLGVVDLFGQEASTNAANYYTMGVKGRYLETRIDDDHVLTDSTFDMDTADNGRASCARPCGAVALNERLRNDYVEDCARA